MRLPADIFLAMRYLRPKRTFVSVITLLSILGPVLGVTVLIVVTAVMAGFDKDIRQGIMDMQAHLQLYPMYSKSINEPKEIVEKLAKFDVKASPVIEGPVLLQVKESITPKVLKGIAPATESNVSQVHKCIKAGRYELKEGEVLVGDMLARQLGIWVGSVLLLHSPARLTQNVKWKDDGTVDVSSPDELYLPEQVKVVGIYSMGVSDFDENIIFIHIDQAADLYGFDWDTATSIQGKVPHPLEMEGLAKEIERSFPDFICETWQQRNQLLFGTLRVEKNLMTFLMAFIVLVASFSISATLITVVVQKTREIGVMKAVGMSRSLIARVFLFQGTIIGVLGTAIGTMLGTLIVVFREQIADFLSWILRHDVFPAELYHLRRIPALITTYDMTFIVCLALVICIMASIIPAIYASFKEPAQALQEDN